MTTVDELIDSLGGADQMADALTADGKRVTRAQIYMWRHRGYIPPAHHPAVVRVARDRGVAILHEDLEGMWRRANQSPATPNQAAE